MSNQDAPNPKAPKKQPPSAPPEGSQLMEMPTINRLLKRKKLEISNTVGKKTEQPAQSRSEKIKTPPKPPPLKRTSLVQPVERRRMSDRKDKLQEWTHRDLNHSSDPLHQAMLHLVEKGATQILYLKPSERADDSQRPHPLWATAGFASGDKTELWKGLCLQGSLIPEIWTKLISNGWVELQPIIRTPSGTMGITSGGSLAATISDPARFLRNVFGLSETEYFLLVLCGDAASFTGVIAVYSRASLQAEVTVTSKKLQDGPPKFSPQLPNLKKKLA